MSCKIKNEPSSTPVLLGRPLLVKRLKKNYQGKYIIASKRYKLHEFFKIFFCLFSFLRAISKINNKI